MILLQAYELHVSKLSHLLSPGCSCLLPARESWLQGVCTASPALWAVVDLGCQLQGEGHPEAGLWGAGWKGQHRHGPICQEDAGHCCKVNLK